MIKIIKDWKAMLITIITTIVVTTATLLITLHVDNIYEKDKIANHEKRIEILEKRVDDGRVLLNTNITKTKDEENEILKIQNELLQNKNTLNNINDNIFEIMKILREDQIIINKNKERKVR